MPLWMEQAKKVTSAEKKARPVQKGLEFGSLKSNREIEHNIKSVRRHPVAAARRDTLMNTLTRKNQASRRKRKAAGRKLRRGTRETTTMYGPRKEKYSSLGRARKSYASR